MRSLRMLILPVFAAAVLPSLVATQTQGAVIQSSNSAQLYTGDSSVSNLGGTIYIGDYGDGAPRNWGEVAFQLPDLGAQSNPFTSANLALTVNGSQYNNSYGYQESHTVGLTQAGSPLTRASGDILSSDVGTSGTDVGLTIGYSDHVDSGTYTSGDITSFLNTAYADGAGVGQYVFFQLQAGGGLIYYKGFNITGSANDPSSAAPLITYTAVAVPEPASLCGLVALIGGAVARRRKN